MACFTAQSRATLETYARLAAAALDAADAMDEARHQADGAQTLLELSTSLAEIVSTEEMASKVVRAVPDVIDCDRVALILDDATWQGAGDGRYRVVASMGYPDDLATLQQHGSFTESEVGALSEYGLVERTNSSPSSSTLATVSAPITVSGNTNGFVVASVTSNPERLAITPRLADRLKGLAAQASISISNAQLVDQI